jgi:hypothetical protein
VFYDWASFSKKMFNWLPRYSWNIAESGVKTLQIKSNVTELLHWHFDSVEYSLMEAGHTKFNPDWHWA